MTTPQALLDLFIREFQPTPKPAAKPKSRKDPLPNHTREQYLVENRFWTPVAAVYHVTEQTCQCCGEATEVLGSILIKHENPRQKASWECRRSTLLSHEDLPKEFITHQETVEQCPRCLRAEAVLCDYPPTHLHQQPLFPH